MRFAVALALCLAVLAAAGPPPAAAQCAMCKAVLEGSPEGRSLAMGLNKAILLMIAAPYVVFGVVMAVAFRKRWPAWLRLRGAMPGARDEAIPIASSAAPPPSPR